MCRVHTVVMTTFLLVATTFLAFFANAQDLGAAETCTEVCKTPRRDCDPSPSNPNQTSCDEDVVSNDEHQNCGLMLPKCPDFHEGLWGRDFYQTQQYLFGSVNNQNTECKRFYENLNSDTYFAPDDTQPELGFNGLPGVYVKEGWKIRCSSDVIANSSLARGFTVSVLIRVNKFVSWRPTPMISLGDEGSDQFPNILLRRSHRRKKQIKLTINIGQQSYRTTKIPSDLFVGKWVHLLITWGEDQGHFVYVDGQEVGHKYSYRTTRSSVWPQNGVLLFGKLAQAGGRKQGNIDAFLSSASFWNSPMTSQQASDVTRFYAEMVSEANAGVREPTLNARMWSHVSAPMRNEVEGCLVPPTTGGGSGEGTGWNLTSLVRNRACPPYF